MLFLRSDKKRRFCIQSSCLLLWDPYLAWCNLRQISKSCLESLCHKWSDSKLLGLMSRFHATNHERFWQILNQKWHQLPCTDLQKLKAKELLVERCVLAWIWGLRPLASPSFEVLSRAESIVIKLRSISKAFSVLTTQSKTIFILFKVIAILGNKNILSRK